MQHVSKCNGHLLEADAGLGAWPNAVNICQSYEDDGNDVEGNFTCRECIRLAHTVLKCAGTIWPRFFGALSNAET